MKIAAPFFPHLFFALPCFLCFASFLHLCKFFVYKLCVLHCSAPMAEQKSDTTRGSSIVCRPPDNRLEFVSRTPEAESSDRVLRLPEFIETYLKPVTRTFMFDVTRFNSALFLAGRHRVLRSTPSTATGPILRHLCTQPRWRPSQSCRSTSTRTKKSPRCWTSYSTKSSFFTQRRAIWTCCCTNSSPNPALCSSCVCKWRHTSEARFSAKAAQI